MSDLRSACTDLGDGSPSYLPYRSSIRLIAAPIKAQMKFLEVQLAQETEALTFAMETLEALIMPHILAAKQSQKVPYVTAVYTTER